MLNNLASTISKVVEELALMIVETPEDDAPVRAEIVGEIEFMGTMRGKLTAASNSELGASLASNLLGLAPDDPETRDKALDAFGEMLNIICGNLVTEMFGTEHAFSLSIPTCRRVEDDGQADHPTALDQTRWSLQESSTLLLDDQPIEFTLGIAMGDTDRPSDDPASE